MRPDNSRPTIGLLIENIAGEGEYHAAIWAGVANVCQERDANLICFVGGSLGFTPGDEFGVQRNAVYDLVTADNVDGLVISGSIGNFVAPEELRSFYDRYRPLPMVSVALTLEGIPSALVDNYGGMRNVLGHLIEVHGCRRIAFIRGPEANEDAEQRYRAYIEGLAMYGLPFDPALVAPGDFLQPSGEAAIDLLLDEGRDGPAGRLFDAVIAANDNMAIGALQTLQARGIRVPSQVAVVGFDDGPDAMSITPPLTTERHPFYELGQQVTEALLAQIEGKEVPEQMVIPTELVVRQSCGCSAPVVVQAAMREPSPSLPRRGGFTVQREDILSEIVKAVGGDERLAGMETRPTRDGPAARLYWAEQLLDALSAELEEETSNTFLVTLEDILRQVMTEGEDVTPWQGALSVLRRYVWNSEFGDNGHDVSRIMRWEDLWQQARVMVGEMAERAQVNRRLEVERQAQTVRGIGQTLIATHEVAELADVLVNELPRLGIPSCYLSLYEPETGRGGPPGPLYSHPAEWSRLIMAYDENGRVETTRLSSSQASASLRAEPQAEGSGEPLEAGGRRFPSHQLVPSEFGMGEAARRAVCTSEPGEQGKRKRSRRYTMVVEPLYFRAEQLGFVLFEVGPQEGSIYEPLRAQISSALRGALLAREVEERTRALQEANYALQRRAMQLEASVEVGRAITSIFDLDRLFRRTVNLVRDQFGFYHAGIFLVDEAGEWALLREATGEAGAQMKAQGHRLAVADTSMVGWTACHRQPRIALHAGEDAVRFANPLLPYTRSEMTLPLMVGAELLGVLNVQSTEEEAFDEDDVRALQSMANQIAVAMENARRVSDEALLLEAASPIYRVSRRLAQVTTVEEVADAIIASVAETGADGCTVVEFEFSPSGEPEALLYRGVWRRDREVRFKPGMRLPIMESPFPFEMVSRILMVADVERDEHLPESAREVFIATGVKALANIPLRLGDRVIGQVVVLRATPGPFSDGAVRLYEALSDQAAVALERAQLLEEAQRRAEREQLTREMIDRIRRALDIEQALQTTAEELSRAMGVPRVSIELKIRE